MDDSFSCPKCGAKFTPATFPFKYEYHSGAMGIGSERVEVLDSPCPKCSASIPRAFFTTCRVCKKGAAKTSCAELKNGSSSNDLYHFGCLNKLGPYDRSRARPYGQVDPPKSSLDALSNIPTWVWIAGGILLLLFLNSR